MKRLYGVIFLTFLCLFVKAEDIRERIVSLEAGLAYANFSLSVKDVGLKVDSDPRQGWHMGVGFVNLTWYNPHFAFGAEADWGLTQKGGTMSFSGRKYGYDVTQHSVLKFLYTDIITNIVAMGRLAQWDDGSAFDLMAGCGGGLNYCVASSGELTVDNEKEQEKDILDDKDVLDFSLRLLAGFRYKTSQRAAIGLRYIYDHGIFSIKPEENVKLKNRTSSIAVTLSFSF